MENRRNENSAVTSKPRHRSTTYVLSLSKRLISLLTLLTEICQWVYCTVLLVTVLDDTSCIVHRVGEVCPAGGEKK
jgi:hypothetical protein